MVTNISNIKKIFEKEMCSDFPNSIWDRKSHNVDLAYIDGFNEKFNSTKARPIQMNHEFMEICKKEIDCLLAKKII